MARTQRNYQLEHRTGRLKLELGKRYWATVGKGLSICYRRTVKGHGQWEARVWKEETYRFKGLGEADDYKEANGTDILTYFQAAEKARQFEQQIEQHAKHPHLKPLKPLTVKQATVHYVEWFMENRKSHTDTLFVINAHILPLLGRRIVSELTTRDIKEWHTKLAAQPPRKRTPTGEPQAFLDPPTTKAGEKSRKATANRILTVLKSILNKAFHDELVEDDTPWRRVKPFGNVDEPLTRFLSEAEAIRLINACPPNFRQLVKAALFTGARYGELVRMRVSHLNKDTHMVLITAEAKSGKGRHVPLSAQGVSFFSEAVSGNAESEHIFLKDDGKPWGDGHQARPMRAACEAANIRPPVGFHELRHTYASLLAQAGADLLTISKLLGHADTRVTSRHYAHLCDKTLSNAVRTLLPGFGHKPDKKVSPIR